MKYNFGFLFFFLIILHIQGVFASIHTVSDISDFTCKIHQTPPSFLNYPNGSSPTQHESNLKELTAVNHPSVRLNGGDLESLESTNNSLSSITSLILLDNVQKNMYKLSWFKSLTELDVSDTNLSRKSYIPNQGLDVISQLTSLKKLNLANIHINDDEGLSLLAKLTNLETLIISNPSINGTGLQKLNNLTHLTNLDLSNTHVTAEYLNQITLRNLRSLRVPASFVGEDQLNAFQNQITELCRGKGIQSSNFDFQRI